MATEEANLADPAFLQFLEMLIDKGGVPLLAFGAVFALVWKFGWPKFGVSYSNPPPPPNAVVEALTHLREEVAEIRADARKFHADTAKSLHEVETGMAVLLDRRK